MSLVWWEGVRDIELRIAELIAAFLGRSSWRGALAMAAAARANSERAAEAVEAAEAVGDAPSDAIVDVHPDGPDEDPPERGH